jgi:hypothetical protein
LSLSHVELVYVRVGARCAAAARAVAGTAGPGRETAMASGAAAGDGVCRAGPTMITMLGNEYPTVPDRTASNP